MRPMLGTAVKDTSKIKYPIAASPKLDGIRALVVNGVLVSRSLKPIRNAHTQALFGRAEFEGLDGELIVGKPTDPHCFRQTTSGVMAYDGEPDIHFWVFDRYNSDAVFVNRHASVIKTVTDCGWPNMHVVPHNRLDSEEVLQVYEQHVIGLGYEGVILRSIKGPYKFGRSTLKEGDLLKVKRFEDSEGEVIELQELMHNTNTPSVGILGLQERSSHAENKIPGNTMGKIVVKDPKFSEPVVIGTGFTAAERQTFWDCPELIIRRTVKYKYFSYGNYDAPRHAVYLGVRDKEDLS